MARVVVMHPTAAATSPPAPAAASLQPAKGNVTRPRLRSMFSFRSDISEDDFSCTDCCRTTLRHLYNFTIDSWLSCFKHKPQDPEFSTSIEDIDVKLMKEKLRVHFMNPFQKWNYDKHRRFPWKLIVQLLSIVLVTVQLSLFANSKSTLMDFLQANKLTFTKLFVIDPSDPEFGNLVPTPIRVIYTNDDLFEQLNFTASQYFQLDQLAVGPYGYQWDLGEGGRHAHTPHLHLTIHKYKNSTIDPASKIISHSRKTVSESYNVSNNPNPIGSTLNWTRVLSELPGVKAIDLDFTITSGFFESDHDRSKCFQFNISLLITNDAPKGNMPVDMRVETQMSDCDDSNQTLHVDSGVLSDTKSTVVDGLVIFISVVSIFLCARSLLYSVYLCKTVFTFFIKKFSWRLKAKHLVPLFNLWFVGLIVSNGLVLVGSIMKLVISYTNPDSIALVDITSIILGLAVFGQWCGLLRFLSYFDKYNMLLITLRLALPSVMRFIICAGILYISFLLCGWLVLGPYNPKFRDPTVTSECLFSLINGDDMFSTYVQMSPASNAAWIFSKIYLYVFVALFIYLVLNVFISLISDTYETLHDHWKVRARGLLKDFATNQLRRGRFKPYPHPTYDNTSIVEGDADDYDFLRDIADGVSDTQSMVDDVFPQQTFDTQQSFVTQSSCPNSSSVVNNYRSPSLTTTPQSHTHTCQSPSSTNRPLPVNRSLSLSMVKTPSTANTTISSSVSNVCLDPTESVRPAILGADHERSPAGSNPSLSSTGAGGLVVGGGHTSTTDHTAILMNEF